MCERGRRTDKSREKERERERECVREKETKETKALDFFAALVSHIGAGDPDQWGQTRT